MTRNIIEELHVEHRTMARLLDLLDRQVSRFERSAEPDYALMQQIVDYFLDFPDRYHHPKEDLLAKLMIERAPARAEPLRGLAGKHEELGLLTRRFQRLLQRVLDEAELPRQQVVRAAREFIASQRYHMEGENRDFLPLAQEVLRAGDLERLDYELFGKQDPLQETKEGAPFAKVRDALLAGERD
ncbi:MAG TPA: hemerythrin domain-containing protein [Kiloniellales bacterium]|nr:hemerythrin domain-containing protein [Kiloniellales bacterium]